MRDYREKRNVRDDDAYASFLLDAALLVDCPNLGIYPKNGNTFTKLDEIATVLKKNFYCDFVVKEAYFKGRKKDTPEHDSFRAIFSPRKDVDEKIILRMGELSHNPKVQAVVLASSDKDYLGAIKKLLGEKKFVFAASLTSPVSHKIVECIGSSNTLFMDFNVPATLLYSQNYRL